MVENRESRRRWRRDVRLRFDADGNLDRCGVGDACGVLGCVRCWTGGGGGDDFDRPDLDELDRAPRFGQDIGGDERDDDHGADRRNVDDDRQDERIDTHEALLLPKKSAQSIAGDGCVAREGHAGVAGYVSWTPPVSRQFRRC